MALNSGNGLVYVGDTLIAGEIRQPWNVGDYIITTTKTVAAAAHAQDPASPTQVISSTAEDFHWLWVQLPTATGGAGLDGRVLLEVWFGAASSEVKQATFNIGSRNGSTTICPTVVSCPFFIPSGTRVSFTTRSARTGQSVSLRWNFGKCDSPVIDQPVGSTVDTTQSIGIIPNNSSSSNTWGTWTEIFASTSVDFQGFHLGLGINGTTTVSTAFNAKLQIGIGAASSEVALDKIWCFDVATTEVVTNQPGEGPHYLNHAVPAGSRIAVRWQHSQSTVTDIDVTLHGIPV